MLIFTDSSFRFVKRGGEAYLDDANTTIEDRPSKDPQSNKMTKHNNMYIHNSAISSTVSAAALAAARAAAPHVSLSGVVSAWL